VREMDNSPEALLLTPTARGVFKRTSLSFVWLERNGRDVPEWAGLPWRAPFGWCTVLFPFELRMQEGRASAGATKRLPSAILRAFQIWALTFALLRYLAPDGFRPKQMGEKPWPYELIFNYLRPWSAIRWAGTGEIVQGPPIVEGGSCGT